MMPPRIPRPDENLTLDEIREQYLASIELRLRASTCRMYAERLNYTLKELAITHAEQSEHTPDR